MWFDVDLLRVDTSGSLRSTQSEKPNIYCNGKRVKDRGFTTCILAND